MSKNSDKKLMVKKSPKKFSTMFGWWVGLDVSGKIKCAVLGRLVEGKTALLILRSVGIFLFVCCRSCRSFRVSANVPSVCEVAYELAHKDTGAIIQRFYMPLRKHCVQRMCRAAYKILRMKFGTFRRNE
jgi:hypothetical protein